MHVKIDTKHVCRARIFVTVREYLGGPVFVGIRDHHTLAENNVAGYIVHAVYVVALLAMHGFRIAGKCGISVLRKIGGTCSAIVVDSKVDILKPLPGRAYRAA